MKKLKSVFIFMLTAVFCFSAALSGCGNSTSTQTSGTAEKTTPPATTAAVGPTEASLAPYELNVVYLCAAVPNDLKLVQDEMSRQLTEKMNATVVLTPVDLGSWGNKTELMFASGDKIDVISSTSAFQYTQNVNKGVYMALNDLLGQYGGDIVGSVGMDIINGTAVGGKIYGVPVLKEMGQSYGLIFNKALVDKYKFDLSTVKTFEDIEPMLKVIKDSEPGITPFCQSSRNLIGTMLMALFDNLGTHWGGALKYGAADLKLIDMFSDPDILNLMDWNHKMYKLGYVNKSSLTDTDEGPMKVGKAFVMPYELKPGKDKEIESSWGIPLVQLDMIPAPVASANIATGIMQSIGSTSKDPARAMMFINALYSDKELLNTFIFGIESRHYVKKSDNMIDFPEGITSQTVGYSNFGWAFGNQFLDYLWSNEAPDKWDNFKAFNEKVVNSPAMGFTFDMSSLSTELATMDGILTKYDKALFTGTVDPRVTLPKLTNELNASGYDRVMAEKQRQLDEWAKTR